MTPRPVPMLPWPSDASLTMPGSKSDANRLLVVAAAAAGVDEREVVITDVTPSDDVLRLLGGLRALGHRVGFDAARARAVIGPRTAKPPARATIDCGNAGTTLRFLVSLAALTPGEWTLTGDAAMQRRPVGPLVDAWQRLGSEVTATNGCPPVRIVGRVDVAGGEIAIDASVSSQFVSSLLLVGWRFANGLTVRFGDALASHDYVTWTMRLLARLGMRIEPAAGSVTLHALAAPPPWPAEVPVAGDWSSAGVWTCLEHLTRSRVRCGNLEHDSGQPDERLAGVLRTLPAGGECTVDVAAIPDQFMNLAVVAAHRAGTTHLTGAANLRTKESDRIAVMARELTRLGADVDERPDGLVVRGGRALRAGTVDPANDHRVAMAFALAGLLSPGIAIAEPECVAKSYPRFWRDLDAVVAQRRCIAVVGMRGVGKSTFARAFAAANGVEAIDTDERFVAAHGAIAAFVEAHGWPAFREHEERLLAASLQPGTVVATGGGAIESAASRQLLRERALVVWLDGDTPLLRVRIATDALARPSVTGAPVLDELETLRALREPLYAEVAHVRLDASLPLHGLIAAAGRELGRPCRWPDAGGGVHA